MQGKLWRVATAVSDILDRTVDKGIVIRTEESFHSTGPTPSDGGWKLVVTSIETHLEHADFLVDSAPTAWGPTRAFAGAPAARGGRTRRRRTLPRGALPGRRAG